LRKKIKESRARATTKNTRNQGSDVIVVVMVTNNKQDHEQDRYVEMPSFKRR